MVVAFFTPLWLLGEIRKKNKEENLYTLYDISSPMFKLQQCWNGCLSWNLTIQPLGDIPCCPAHQDFSPLQNPCIVNIPYVHHQMLAVWGENNFGAPSSVLLPPQPPLSHPPLWKSLPLLFSLFNDKIYHSWNILVDLAEGERKSKDICFLIAHIKPHLTPPHCSFIIQLFSVWGWHWRDLAFQRARFQTVYHSVQ